MYLRRVANQLWNLALTNFNLTKSDNLTLVPGLRSPHPLSLSACRCHSAHPPHIPTLPPVATQHDVAPQPNPQRHAACLLLPPNQPPVATQPASCCRPSSLLSPHSLPPVAAKPACCRHTACLLLPPNQPAVATQPACSLSASAEAQLLALLP